MAFAVKVLESKFKRKVTLTSGVEVVAGSILNHDGTTWALADASAQATHGQLVALESGSGDAVDTKAEVEAAPYAVLEDEDAPYTQDATLYTSDTAGEITETAPPGASDLIQVIGVAQSTSVIEISIKPPQEVTVQVPVASFLVTAAYLLQDAGPAAGITLAAVNDSIQFNWHAPRNSIGIVRSILGWSANIELDASDTIDVAVSSVAAGEANDLLTDTIASVALTVAADDVAESDIIAALDAAGIGTPGDWVSVDINKSAEGTGGDDPVVYGLSITYLQV